MYNIDKDLKEVEDIFSKMSSKEFDALIKFYTIRKLSNKWPYDTFKSSKIDKDKFIKHFLLNAKAFKIIYEEWKNYNAKRDTKNKK